MACDFTLLLQTVAIMLWLWTNWWNTCIPTYVLPVVIMEWFSCKTFFVRLTIFGCVIGTCHLVFPFCSSAWSRTTAHFWKNKKTLMRVSYLNQKQIVLNDLHYLGEKTIPMQFPMKQIFVVKNSSWSPHLHCPDVHVLVLPLHFFSDPQ